MKDQPKIANAATMEQQADQAAQAAARSSMLWRVVNRDIARLLKKAVELGHSREEVADFLDSCADSGDKKLDAPVCLCNYKSAANAVRDGVDLVLI